MKVVGGIFMGETNNRIYMHSCTYDYLGTLVSFLARCFALQVEKGVSDMQIKNEHSFFSISHGTAVTGQCCDNNK